VKGLHEQSTDAADESAKVTVNDPGRIGGHKQPAGFSGTNGFEPCRNAFWVTREQAAELDRKEFLNAIVF
jgi:hypothetical protein